MEARSAAACEDAAMTLSTLDWLVIALYGLAIAVIGFLIVRKTKTAEGYFLAGRTLTGPFIGASLFAANISAEHFVGLAGGGSCVFGRCSAPCLHAGCGLPFVMRWRGRGLRSAVLPAWLTTRNLKMQKCSSTRCRPRRSPARFRT